MTNMQVHGEEIRLGIVGARRRRNGLGEYLARFAHEEGAKIVGIVGRSIESASETAKYLQTKYQITTRPYANLPALLREEHIHGLLICSPRQMHLEHLRQATQERVAIFCEKPFLWNAGRNVLEDTNEILDRLEGNQQRILLNTQWPKTLETFYQFYPEMRHAVIETFTMELAPSGTGVEMLLEAVSHPISMLIRLVGVGTLQNEKCKYVELPNHKSVLTFDYQHQNGIVKTTITLEQKKELPRPASYSINGLAMHRKIDLTDYSISFFNVEREIAADDPQKIMLRRFLRVVRQQDQGHQWEEIQCHSHCLDQLHRVFA